MGLQISWAWDEMYCRWFDEFPGVVGAVRDGDVSIWWDRDVIATKWLGHSRRDLVVIDGVKEVGYNGLFSALGKEQGLDGE